MVQARDFVQHLYHVYLYIGLYIMWYRGSYWATVQCTIYMGLCWYTLPLVIHRRLKCGFIFQYRPL